MKREAGDRQEPPSCQACRGGAGATGASEGRASERERKRSRAAPSILLCMETLSRIFMPDDLATWLGGSLALPRAWRLRKWKGERHVQAQAGPLHYGGLTTTLLDCQKSSILPHRAQAGARDG